MVFNEGENLCFILSIPRSGSTILSLLLSNHSQVYCPPEPWLLLKLANLLQLGSNDSAFNDILATRNVCEFLPTDIFIKSARAFALTVYNSYLQTVGKTIFVDKTPRYYHILPFIEELFPKARKIWLKRNPLDVALSYQTSWNVEVREMTGQKISDHSFDFALGLFNLAAYFNTPSPYKFELRYEELVTSPEQHLMKICNFLDIPYEADAINFANNTELISLYKKSSNRGDLKALQTSGLHQNSLKGWQNRLSLSDVQQMVKLLGYEIFDRMGYSDTIETLNTLGIEFGSEAQAQAARDRITITKIDPLRQAEFEIDQIRSSWSWRLTEPLRNIAKILHWKKIKRYFTSH